MIEKTPAQLLEEYKNSTQPTAHQNLDYFLKPLPGIAGAYSAFDNGNRNDFVASVASDVAELRNVKATGILRDGVREGVKKPTIGLYFEYTSKYNLKLSWRPLNYGADNKSEDFDFSKFYLYGNDSYNEIAFIRDIQYLNSIASISHLSSETAVPSPCNSSTILRTILAQKTIECLQSAMVKIADNLRHHYDVWILNDLSFPKVENTNVKMSYVDTPEKIQMLKNATDNNSVYLKHNDYETIEFKNIISIEQYRKIKIDCQTKSYNIKAFNKELEQNGLNTQELVDFIKRYKRNPARVSEVLSTHTKKNITSEQLIVWVDKMYELDKAQAEKYFGPKGGLIMNEDKPSQLSPVKLKDKIANQRDEKVLDSIIKLKK